MVGNEGETPTIQVLVEFLDAEKESASFSSWA